jgi:hypothetical protein
MVSDDLPHQATLSKPADLNVPAAKFADFFGEEWTTVLAEDRAFNALDMKEKLGGNLDELNAKWDATGESGGKRIKFGGGFYCGLIEHDGVKYYTFNAFFMRMRGKFTDPQGSIHYFAVKFAPSALSWADFRGKVLGPTDPAKAPPESLRGTLFSGWEGLGLASAPNTGDNGVHASASPFEGLGERKNWLKTALSDKWRRGALIVMRDYALASTEQRPTGMARRTAALSAQLSQELSALGIDLSRQRGACARAPPGAARF